MSMFKNPAIEDNFKKNGFILIDAGLSNEIDILERYIHGNFDLSPTDFYYSLLSNPFEQNIVLRDFIKEVLRSFYEKTFQGCRTLTESFLSKPANTGNEIYMHQDWCYTDESQYEAYNIWVPLQDVTKENGAMVFLPGSHLWFDQIRSSTLPTARVSSQYFLDHGIEPIEMKRGQALVFHPAVYHGSGPNLSPENRTVVTATVMQADAPFLYFQKEGERKVNVLRPDDDFFLKDLHSLAVGGDAGLPANEQIDYIYKTINESDLISKFNESITQHIH